jgi:hypothetical protein
MTNLNRQGARSTFISWVIPLLTICWMWGGMSQQIAYAQSALGGWTIQVVGNVQVEPGQDVVTLGVKKEEIRFGVHNVRSSDQDFSNGRFLIDVRQRTPGLIVKGPDHLLELLIHERPRKRILRLTGTYYQDSRMFLVNDIEPLREKPSPTTP